MVSVCIMGGGCVISGWCLGGGGGRDVRKAVVRVSGCVTEKVWW